jgi:hypothetical protein
VGYWAFLSDPDGHTLEISHGQEVGFAVKESVTASSNKPQMLGFRKILMPLLPCSRQMESLLYQAIAG